MAARSRETTPCSVDAAHQALEGVKADHRVLGVDGLAHEHHAVQVGVVGGVGVVGPAEHQEVGHGVARAVDVVEVGGQAAERLPAHGPAQLVHAAEVGVDGHRRGAHVRRQPPQGEAVAAFAHDQGRGRLDERRADGGVGGARAHVDHFAITAL
jgi:hypothetical protein